MNSVSESKFKPIVCAFRGDYCDGYLVRFTGRQGWGRAMMDYVMDKDSDSGQ